MDCCVGRQGEELNRDVEHQGRSPWLVIPNFGSSGTLCPILRIPLCWAAVGVLTHLDRACPKGGFSGGGPDACALFSDLELGLHVEGCRWGLDIGLFAPEINVFVAFVKTLENQFTTLARITWNQMLAKCGWSRTSCKLHICFSILHDCMHLSTSDVQCDRASFGRQPA